MGGIDAEELQNARPLLRHLTHLTFGPGHKLTKDVLLETFLCIPKLEDLTVFYDNFVNGNVDNPGFLEIVRGAKEQGLPKLRSIIIQHQGIGTAHQFSDFFTWIDALSARSPLERLEIHSDDGRKSYFDHSILETLKRKQLTLRRLVMPRVLVRREALLLFLQTMRLEELRIGVDKPKVKVDAGKLPVAGWMMQSASVYSQGAR
ncbi:hypothetical protein OE88DRAFT_1656602 [Heliocybe sulcata]|uniref:F-box domain-containing protein n=1 Tax=Heliocybe sulcata TaxID=5364 RepID=A0A5C3N6L7_9AGAM|nr:hypothetical protein OE88DRAFT_1656602 [Heliocybe sulcata]